MLIFQSCIFVGQVGQTNHVIDNIHSIIAAAAVKFDSAQLENLFLLIQKVSHFTHCFQRENILNVIARPKKIKFIILFVLKQKWQDDHNRMKEKLLRLIGKIGRDAKEPKTTTRVRQ